MHKIVIFLLILFLAHLQADTQISIGTGSKTGVYFPTGQNLCQVLQQETTDITSCKVHSTKGSIDNIQAIKSQQFSFGIAQSDTVFQAYNGLGSFKGQPYKNLRTVLSIYPELFTFVVRKNANIKIIHDINNKTINIGNIGSGQRATSELLFKESKPLNQEILKETTSLNNEEANKALISDTIDGYFYVTGHPSETILQTSRQKDIDIIEVSPDTCLTVKYILMKYPFYTLGVIPANTYHNIPHQIKSFGVKATLVTDKDTDPQLVESILKTVFDNLEAFKKLHPAYATITKETLTEGIGAPFHQGAINYFIKEGILK